MAKLIRRFRSPRDSGPHRIACKALYRALLEQCPRIPLPADLPSQGAVNPIKHLIRKGFRRPQYTFSPRLTVKALKTGYDAEKLLHAAATGSQPALSQIHDILRHLHERRQVSKQPQPPRRERPRVWAYPDAPKVLDIRPLPREQLSGRRHVPILTHSTGFPFLRFKKPQSPFLSRVLRDKMKQKHNRSEKISELEDEEENFAAWEDKWESAVLAQLEREGGARGKWVEEEEWGSSYGWRKELRRSKAMIYKQIDDEAVKAKERGLKMMEIMDRERELYNEERSLRRHEKKLEKKRKKEEAMREAEAPTKEDID